MHAFGRGFALRDLTRALSPPACFGSRAIHPMKRRAWSTSSTVSCLYPLPDLLDDVRPESKRFVVAIRCSRALDVHAHNERSSLIDEEERRTTLTAFGV